MVACERIVVTEQECIPVGCVPPAAVAVLGGSPPGTPSPEQTPPGAEPPPGTRHPPPGNRHPQDQAFPRNQAAPSQDQASPQEQTPPQGACIALYGMVYNYKVTVMKCTGHLVINIFYPLHVGVLAQAIEISFRYLISEKCGNSLHTGLCFKYTT